MTGAIGTGPDSESSLAARNPNLKRVLHVLPSDVARGAQVYARSLRLALDQPGCEHRTMTIFDSPPVALHADMSAGARTGPLRMLDPVAVLRLRVALRRWKPDVVVAHGGEALKYLFCSRVRERIVYYAIGVVAESAWRGFRKRFYQLQLSAADVVVAVSQETLDELREMFGVSPDRLQLIPNGRAVADYAGGEGEVRQVKEPVALIFVGHLTASKRPDWFVRLADRLLSDGKTITAQLVGDGPLQETLAASAEAAGVSMLGRRQDVPTLIRGADIFVFTSVAEGEGMPGVLIEAAMAGLPIVATDVPGASTVIEQGVTGFVTGVDDLEALVQATARLVDDAKLRQAMGEASRRRAVRMFSLESSARKWRDLFDSVGP